MLITIPLNFILHKHIPNESLLFRPYAMSIEAFRLTFLVLTSILKFFLYSNRLHSDMNQRKSYNVTYMTTTYYDSPPCGLFKLFVYHNCMISYSVLYQVVEIIKFHYMTHHDIERWKPFLMKNLFSGIHWMILSLALPLHNLNI